MDGKYDVFISYARADYKDKNNNIIEGNVISQIKEAFDINGISYWIDEGGIYTGDNFAPKITKAIEASKIFLFISSQNSNKSTWVQGEVAVAHENEKDILPFKLDNTKYATNLSLYLQALDFCDYPKEGAKAVTILVESVKAKLYSTLKEQEEVYKQSYEQIIDLLKDIRTTNQEISKKFESFTNSFETFLTSLGKKVKIEDETKSSEIRTKSEPIPIKKEKREEETPHAIASDNKRTANIIFVIDSSESAKMANKEKLTESLIKTFDYFSPSYAVPKTLDVRISILLYATSVQWILLSRPISGIPQNEEIKNLQMGDDVKFGAALDLLDNEMSDSILFDDQMEYAKSLVVFIPYNVPTDSWEIPYDRIQDNPRYQESKLVILQDYLGEQYDPILDDIVPTWKGNISIKNAEIEGISKGDYNSVLKNVFTNYLKEISKQK